MLKQLTVILLFGILFSSVSIADESYDITIVKDSTLMNNALIKHEITFNGSRSFLFDFGLPDDAEDVSLKVDGVSIDLNGAEEYLIENSKEIVLEYSTQSIIHNINDEILFNFKTLTKDMVKVSLTLDEGMYLRFDEQQNNRLAIYPQDFTLSSDGQRIIIHWEKEGAEEFSGLVLIKEKKRNLIIITSIISIILFSLILLVLFRKDILPKDKQKKLDDLIESIKKEIDRDMLKKQENNLQIHKEMKEDPKKETSMKDVFDHLKEDEKQVIRILNKRDGSCEQATLRLIGDFSKATLSRILMELEERNVIIKEKRGKKNIIHLKHK